MQNPDYKQIAERYRADIPQAREGLVYLNHCAVSPVTDGVRNAMLEALDLRRNARIDRFERQLEVFAEARTRLAKITGAGSPDRVAFVPNTTVALNTVARGFPWQPGDEVIVADCEFASNVYAWTSLEKRGVKTVFVPAPDGMVTPDRISSMITPKTRMVAVSAVQYVSGYRADLHAIGRLCNEHGLFLVVDGIQALGALPQNMAQWGADAYCGGAHKWLMGPQGIGYLCLSERLHNLLEPVAPGWLSVPDPWDLFNFDQEPEPSAKRHEGGTYNTTGIFGLNAALEMLLEAGPERTEAHIHRLTGRLIEGLSAADIRPVHTLHAPVATASGSGTPNVWDHRSGIVAFPMSDGADAAALVQFYNENRIFISVRSGILRVAPHFWNTSAEIDHFIDTTVRMPGVLDMFKTKQARSSYHEL
jgi:cysteine desulfurase / selenocysteine lyase